MGWSPGELPLRLAEVVPAGLTHLSLTEDLVTQCTYEWDEELVLDELRVFLSVWRTVTPDLQVVEVWPCQVFDRWKDENVAELRMMCEEAGVLCIVHLKEEPSCSPITYQWVRQCYQPIPWPRHSTLPVIDYTSNIPTGDPRDFAWNESLP